MAEVIVNSQNFEEEVLGSDIPVIVDLWATWCGPCKMIAPLVAEIAEEFAGKVKVCKLDVDQSPDVAMAYKVVSIPTLLYFKDGKLENSVVGFMPKDKILQSFGLN